MRILLLFACSCFLVACSPSLAQQSGAWQPIAPRLNDSFRPDLITLSDGRVLALGGTPGPNQVGASDLAQIYDPRGNRWTAAPRIPEARVEPALAALRTGGELVAGGSNDQNPALRSVYEFDPKQGSWSRLADMHVARSGARAATLGDGRVLVVGGSPQWTDQFPMLQSALADAELFDPATNTWSVVPPLPGGGVARATVSVLPDGRVLVAGGTGENFTSSQAAVFDPSSSSWRTLRSMVEPRSDAAAEITSGGQLVLLGGQMFTTYGFMNPALAPEVLDLREGSWTLGSPPTSQQANNFLLFFSAATPLSDGRILVIGRIHEQLLTAYVYDPTSDFWQVAARPPSLDVDPSLVTLRDGRVLAVSGAKAWVYDPSRSNEQAPTPSGWLDSAGTTLVLLAVAALLALATLWRRLS